MEDDMATELGIGVRCWTGWHWDIDPTLAARMDPRCRIAVIREGPWLEISNCRPTRVWSIEFEDDGDRCIATSDVLFPIDDWDEDLNRREDVDKPEEVCCD